MGRISRSGWYVDRLQASTDCQSYRPPTRATLPLPTPTCFTLYHSRSRQKTATQNSSKDKHAANSSRGCRCPLSFHHSTRLERIPPLLHWSATESDGNGTGMIVASIRRTAELALRSTGGGLYAVVLVGDKPRTLGLSASELAPPTPLTSLPSVRRHSSFSLTFQLVNLVLEYLPDLDLDIVAVVDMNDTWDERRRLVWPGCVCPCPQECHE